MGPPGEGIWTNPLPMCRTKTTYTGFQEGVLGVFQNQEQSAQETEHILPWDIFLENTIHVPAMVACENERWLAIFTEIRRKSLIRHS